MRKIGLIARSDKSGLGQGQTKRLARLLNPHCIMHIDSTSFNGNKQHPIWYKDFGFTYFIDGFPTNEQVEDFCKQVDIVITCETFYNREFTMIAKQMGVKTILIANPEFFDWFKPDWDGRVTLPDKVIVPSQWMMDKMKRFNAEYLPTPIFEDEFKQAREINLKRTGKPRFIHIAGKLAAKDRNGTLLLLEALPYSKGDYDLVIRSQGMLPNEYKTTDPRVTYDSRDLDRQEDMFINADALIFPRRYGGQALGATEALSSALPVIMPRIDPNIHLLPPEWLVDAFHADYLMTRIRLELYSTYSETLANKIDWLAGINIKDRNIEKMKALSIAKKEFDAEVLRPKYEKLLKEMV